MKVTSRVSASTFFVAAALLCAAHANAQPAPATQPEPSLNSQRVISRVNNDHMVILDFEEKVATHTAAAEDAIECLNAQNDLKNLRPIAEQLTTQFGARRHQDKDPGQQVLDEVSRGNMQEWVKQIKGDLLSSCALPTSIPPTP